MQSKAMPQMEAINIYLELLVNWELCQCDVDTTLQNFI